MQLLTNFQRRKPLHRGWKRSRRIWTRRSARPLERPGLRFHELIWFLYEEALTAMSVTIEIPTAFRRFTDGAPKVDCSAATVADALNEEDIRFLGGESCSLKEGDRVLLVPSIAGGC